MNVENVSASVASALSLTPRVRQPEPAAEAKAQEQAETGVKDDTRRDSYRLVDISV